MHLALAAERVGWHQVTHLGISSNAAVRSLPRTRTGKVTRPGHRAASLGRGGYPEPKR